MEMFLMVAAMSLLGVAVSSGLFAAATRGMESGTAQPEAKPVDQLVIAPARFFVDDRVPTQGYTAVPVEALLLQIERHVALEQAAAESFLHAPTAQSLHSRTLSPLVH